MSVEKQTISSKFFLRDFNINKCFMPDREAHFDITNPNTYIIHNLLKNKSFKVEIGETINNVGIVTIDDNNDLIIGDCIIATGESIHKTAKAIPRGKATIINSKKTYHSYIINIDNNKWIRHEIGTPFINFGASSIDRYGNILFIDKNISIKTFHWVKEMTLMFTNNKSCGGHVSYFNIGFCNEDIKPSIGIKGIFYPSKSLKKPSVFSEIKEYRDNQGRTIIKYLKTVSFWPHAESNRFITHARSAEEAEKEAIANEFIKIIEKVITFSKIISFDPLPLFALIESAAVNANIFIYSRYTLDNHLKDLAQTIKLKRELAYEQGIMVSDQEIAEMIEENLIINALYKNTIDSVKEIYTKERETINKESWLSIGLFNKT